jgi:hypothetical protein
MVSIFRDVNVKSIETMEVDKFITSVMQHRSCKPTAAEKSLLLQHINSHLVSVKKRKLSAFVLNEKLKR